MVLFNQYIWACIVLGSLFCMMLEFGVPKSKKSRRSWKGKVNLKLQQSIVSIHCIYLLLFSSRDYKYAPPQLACFCFNLLTLLLLFCLDICHLDHITNQSTSAYMISSESLIHSPLTYTTEKSTEATMRRGDQRW
jgi:hypothetical protein